MNVYLWQAGTVEGVTGTEESAQESAAAWMDKLKADTAVVEQAHYVFRTMLTEAGYERTGRDPYWTGRRNHRGGVSWRRRVREPQLAAS